MAVHERRRRPDRRVLADELAEQLVAEIVSGTYPPGSMLPAENGLAQLANVSRLTVREAVKILRSKSVLRVRHGVGTFVRPIEEWSPLDPILLVIRCTNGSGDLDMHARLLEARRLVEVSVADLAGARRTDTHLEQLTTALEQMRTAHRAGDIDAFVDADIAFHTVIFEAAANPFIAALFDPLQRILVLTRHQTSGHAEMREHAIKHHETILDALTAGDQEAVRRAMHDHLRQTETDVESYMVDTTPVLAELRRGRPQPTPADLPDRGMPGTQEH